LRRLLAVRSWPMKILSCRRRCGLARSATVTGNPGTLLRPWCRKQGFKRSHTTPYFRRSDTSAIVDQIGGSEISGCQTAKPGDLAACPSRGFRVPASAP
jgi:hypothetical protein